MKNIPVLLLFACVLYSCNYKSQSEEGLRNGFYQLAEESKTLDCLEIDCIKYLREQTIINSDDLEITFEYNYQQYADTFSVIHLRPKNDFKKEYEEIRKRFEGEELYYVLDGKILAGTKLFKEATIRICTCDLLERDVKDIEKRMNNSL